MHGIDLNHNYTKCEIKNIVNESFKRKWAHMLADVSSNPLLRTYITLKSEVKIEPFLCKIKNPKYRVAFAKLRASSHSLEIERGRHSKPKTHVNSRVCHFCKIIEDEPHFFYNMPSLSRWKANPNVACIIPISPSPGNECTRCIYISSH